MNRIMDVLTYIPKCLGLIKSNDKISNAPIDDIIAKLDTLDIVLLHGQDYWASYLIEWGTWNEFSHIGIVVRSPTYIDPSLTDVYLLESGPEPTPDPEDHKIKFGVQFTPLKQLLEGYDGRIYYRKLDSQSFKENPQHYYDKLVDIHKIIHDKPYDENPLDLLKADLRLKLGNCRKTNEFFCSALTGFIYTQLGFLPADTDWDILLPKDFDCKYKVQTEMEQQHLGILGPLVKIK